MSNTNEKPKVDPAKIIVRDPVMIKGSVIIPKGESLHHSKGENLNKSDGDKK